MTNNKWQVVQSVPWEVARNDTFSSHERPYVVVRNTILGKQYSRTKSDVIRRFATWEAASNLADKLNAKDVQ